MRLPSPTVVAWLAERRIRPIGEHPEPAMDGSDFASRWAVLDGGSPATVPLILILEGDGTDTDLIASEIDRWKNLRGWYDAHSSWWRPPHEAIDLLEVQIFLSRRGSRILSRSLVTRGQDDPIWRAIESGYLKWGFTPDPDAPEPLEDTDELPDPEPTP